MALLFVAQCLLIFAQERAPTIASDSAKTSLSEVRDKRYALLIVFRSGVVDASNNERAMIDLVLKADPQPKGRYQFVYGQLAKKLNGYIRKYKSLSAAHELNDADYVIFFNVVEYRRILNTIYPYGELFVIIKGTPETNRPPRVIWRSKKILSAGDAVSDLIRELKDLRGEN
jgi:hypothetical protein